MGGLGGRIAVESYKSLQNLAESGNVLTGTPGIRGVPGVAGRLRGADFVLCFALAALVDLAVGGRVLAGVWAGGLVNPDSYMRLVRLDEMLEKGQVLDSVFRDGSGAGTQLHWAHLVDGLLVLLAAPLRLLMPWRDALHAVAAGFGPLGVGALGVAAAWAAAPVAARGFLWLAPLAAGLAPAVAGYGIAGVLHHHVPLMVVATVLGGLALRACLGTPGRGVGWAMGAWSAVGIWFTPEAMPFILLGFGIVWVGWLESPRDGVGASMVRGAGFGFLAAMLLVWAVDPPRPDRFLPVPDRASVVHVAMAAACALAACFTWAVEAVRRRWLVGVVAGVVPVLGWIALFPGLLRGAEGLLDPATAALFFRGISEMAPVRGVADSLTYLSGGALGVAVLGALAWRGRRLALWAAAVAALALLAFSVQHVRFASYPACLAAAILPVALTRLTWALAGRAESRLALARVGVIAGFVLVPQLGSALAVGGGAAPPPGTAGAACPVSAAVPLLAGHGGRVVLSDVNDVPEILYRTRVKTVGSLYHRSPQNYLRLRAAWRSDPARDGDAALRAAGVELVLHCARPRRTTVVADLPGGTLLDALDAGQPPGFLTEIGRGEAGYTLYALRP